ncbi:MAG TPA: hypothetical protein VKP88_03380 [Candidatus Paceibacterota bacterium]|nr:hypothetical protein [Candidatus Paceibacterota bacterium]
MTADELLQAADRLIAYADEIAPTDIPNFSAWRYDYKDYLQAQSKQLDYLADYFMGQKPVTGRQAALGDDVEASR